MLAPEHLSRRGSALALACACFHAVIDLAVLMALAKRWVLLPDSHPVLALVLL